jgi:hypothetical protein
VAGLCAACVLAAPVSAALHSGHTAPPPPGYIRVMSPPAGAPDNLHVVEETFNDPIPGAEYGVTGAAITSTGSLALPAPGMSGSTQAA